MYIWLNVMEHPTTLWSNNYQDPDEPLRLHNLPRSVQSRFLWFQNQNMELFWYDTAGNITRVINWGQNRKSCSAPVIICLLKVSPICQIHLISNHLKTTIKRIGGQI